MREQMLIGLFCKAPTRLVWLWALQASCILISVSYCLLFAAQRHVLTYMEDAVSQLLENREDISQYGIARFFTE